VTTHYADRCFAFDQFGPLSIRPVHGSSWAPQNRPARLPATYHRTHGIRYFHGCYCLADDQLRGVMRERKGGDHTLAALQSIRTARPGGYRLFVILDNLSANKTPAIRRWAARANVELCFTPTNASWTNPRRNSGQSAPLSWAALTTPITPCWPATSRTTCAGATQRPPPRRPGRPAPRTRPHPQRTPATLGTAQSQSRMSDTANVHGQPTSRVVRVTVRLVRPGLQVM
jgi:DDE superfamily endonuclease